MYKKSLPHIESKNNKTDSIVYYNANLYNNPVNQEAKLAIFDQNISSGSIVDLPENYYMSIVRFSISHMVIPLYFFVDNYYSITLQSRAVPATINQQFLVYQSAGSYSQYGFNQPVFYYQQFVNMINKAFKDAITALGLVVDSIFIQYDTTLEKFVIYIDPNVWFPVATNPSVYRLYMNANLFQQLQLFNSTFNGYKQPNGTDYEIQFIIQPAFANLVTIHGNDYLSYTQEKNALYLLNEIQSIVFTTASLNISKEYIGRNDGTGRAGSLPILADFVPDLSAGRDLSQYQYVPNGPLRLINLTNTIPITSVDYQIGIKTRSGKIFPLYLEPGEVSEVKFGFFKKSLYDNDFQY
jgi:hypothetical protein